MSAEREALTVWALCFGATLIAYVASPPAGKVAATVGFLYLPLYACQRRGEDWPDFGLSRARLGADFKQFLGVAAVVFPLFIGGYFAFTVAWPHLPSWVLASQRIVMWRPAMTHSSLPSAGSPNIATVYFSKPP